jgi:hypothetical protein
MKVLIEKLQAIDPDMADDVIKALVQIVEEKIDEAKKEGFDNGFSDGISKIEEMDQQAANALNEVKEAYEAKIVEAIENTRSECDSEATAELTKLEEAMDDHATKALEDLVERMDTVFSENLEGLMEAVNMAHEDEINEMKEVHDVELSETVEKKTQEFLDEYVAESMPEAEVMDSIKLKRLEEAISKMRDILVINDDYVQSEVSEALDDAQSQIDEKQDNINKLMVENMDLRKQIKKDEAARLLEVKISDMKPAQAAFVKQFFDKIEDPKVIAEKLDEAVKAFEADEAEETEKIVESKEKEGAEYVIPKDDQAMILEGVDQNVSMMDQYAQVVEGSYKS